jgi:hypothetical protein
VVEICRLGLEIAPILAVQRVAREGSLKVSMQWPSEDLGVKGARVAVVMNWK